MQDTFLRILALERCADLIDQPGDDGEYKLILCGVPTDVEVSAIEGIAHAHLGKPVELKVLDPQDSVQFGILTISGLEEPFEDLFSITIGHTPIQVIPAAAATQIVAKSITQFNVNKRSDIGLSPLLFSCDKGLPAMVSRCLAVGADTSVEIVDVGNSAAHFAAARGSLECLQLLPPETYSRLNSHNDTPLMFAVSAQHESCVRFLSASTSHTINNMNNSGHTALSLACELGSNTMAALLLQAGASPFPGNNKSKTRTKPIDPMHIANSKVCVGILEDARRQEELRVQALAEELTTTSPPVHKNKSRKKKKKRSGADGSKPTARETPVEASSSAEEPSPSPPPPGSGDSIPLELRNQTCDDANDGTWHTVSSRRSPKSRSPQSHMEPPPPTPPKEDLNQRTPISSICGDEGESRSSPSFTDLFEDRFPALAMSPNMLMFDRDQLATNLSVSQLEALATFHNTQLHLIQEARIIQAKVSAREELESQQQLEAEVSCRASRSP